MDWEEALILSQNEDIGEDVRNYLRLFLESNETIDILMHSDVHKRQYITLVYQLTGLKWWGIFLSLS
jgi:hypothetical protein